MVFRERFYLSHVLERPIRELLLCRSEDGRFWWRDELEVAAARWVAMVVRNE